MRAGQGAQYPELTHTRETQGAFSFFYYGICRRPHGSRGGLASVLFLVTLSVKALVLCGNDHR